MRVVKANTSLGKRLISIGQNWEGTFLNQVYDKWSTAKNRKHGINAMMSIVIQKVQKCLVFVHIIVLVLQCHGLHRME